MRATQKQRNSDQVRIMEPSESGPEPHSVGDEAFPNIFDELPVESIAHIFSYLPATHLCELSKASRQAAEVADLDIVWRPVVQREFGAHSRQQRREVEARYESIAEDPLFKASTQLNQHDTEGQHDVAELVTWKDIYRYYFCWPLATDAVQVKRRALMMYHRSWVRDIVPSPIPADFTETVSHGESDRFMTCSDDLSIVELDLSNQTIAIKNSYPKAHENHILNLELNQFADLSDPKSIVMASAGSDCSIHLWKMDRTEGKIVPGITMQGHDRLVRCVRFASPDTLVSCAHDSTVRVWDIPAGTLRTTIECDEEQLDVMDFDLLSPRIAACSCSDGTIKILDLDSREIIHSLAAHDDAVRRIRVLQLPESHAEGWDCIRTLNPVDHPKTFEEWDAARGDSALNIPGFSPRAMWNTLLISCSYDRSLKIWSLATLKLLVDLPAVGTDMETEWPHLGQFSSVEIYPRVGLHHNNAIIITGSYDHRIRIWDLNSGKVIRTLTGHAGIPCIAKLWRDRIISVGTDGTVNEWRPRPPSEKTTSTLFFHARDSKETMLKEITAPDVLDQLMRLQDRLAHLAHLAQNAMQQQNNAAGAMQGNDDDDDDEDDQEEFDTDDEELFAEFAEQDF